MSLNYLPEYLERFTATLGIVAKEAFWLERTRQRLFEQTHIDKNLMINLSANENLADMLESFVSRFNRMQDTIGDKLLPRLMLLEGEKIGNAIENYNKAEHKGFIQSTDDWLLMRSLRNKLIHEYLEDIDNFLESLYLANKMTNNLLFTYQEIRNYTENILKISLDFD